CSDGLFCNGAEQWTGGACQPASSNMTLACDDRDPCTIDSCDENLGKCRQAILNTTDCVRGVCGGDTCHRSCVKGQQCGADGCGGSCGLCQQGQSCVEETGQCTSSL